VGCWWVGIDVSETDTETDDYVTVVSGDIVVAGYTGYETVEKGRKWEY
jgi:hypothetical protein